MSDAIFRQTCPHCKDRVLDFDLYDEKPILCPGCKVLVAHPGAGGHHPGVEMLRSMDRGDQAINQLHSQMMGGRRAGHEFVGIEQMTSDELSKSTVLIVKECFKRMNLQQEDWPLRLNSILELLGIGNVVLPPGTKERDAKLRKLLGYD